MQICRKIFVSKNNFGNYIRVDTNFILNDNFRQCEVSLLKATSVNYGQFKETSFVAQMNAAAALMGKTVPIKTEGK